MPEFPPHHLIARAVVAGHVHAAHVGAARRLGPQNKRYTVVDAVDFRNSLHPGKGKPEGAEIVGKRLGGFRHLISVVSLARLDGDQRLELFVLLKVVALQLDPRDDKALPFGNVHGDRNALFVRRNGNLGGIDLELKIAARQIIGTQGLDIRVELGPGVAVGFGVPAQPAAGIKVKKSQQSRLIECLVAGDANFLNFRHVAFYHAEGEVHAVALNGRHRGDDLDAVQALVDVLTFQFLLGLVGKRLVERLAIGNADIAQRLAQDILVEFLIADKIDIGYGGSFLNNDDQHIAIDFQPHILEKTQAKQCADGGGALVVAVSFTHAKRKRREDRSGLYPLQTFHPDVTNRKRVDGPCGMCEKHTGGDSTNRTNFESMDLFLHEM